MNKVSVMLVEDDPNFREALARLIAAEESTELAGVAGDAYDAGPVAGANRPDVALVDVRIPRGGGIKAVQAIVSASPNTKPLALSALDSRGAVVNMLRAGAVGYLTKNSSPAEIVAAINAAAAGRSTLSPEVTFTVIRELTARLDQAEAHARALKGFEKRKCEIVQILSHELRTPVTAVQGAASMLVDHWPGGLEAQELDVLYGSIQQATARISRLADRVSMVASLAAGFQVEPTAMRVARLLGDALEQFQGRPFHVEVAENANDRIMADPILAVRALEEVVQNAVAFSPPDEAVEIGAERTQDRVAVSVADRGPGIPPEVAPKIFDAFVQADSTSTRFHQGLGIGLHLADRIMAAHGGSIKYRRRAGGGSVFSLLFAPAA